MNRTIEIPKGYAPSNIEIKDGLVTMFFEPIEPPETEFIPKDGDFCTLINNMNRKYFFIYKNESKNNFYFYIQV